MEGRRGIITEEEEEEVVGSWSWRRGCEKKKMTKLVQCTMRFFKA